MKYMISSFLVAALLLPAAAQAGTRADKSNASSACKSERAAMGGSNFKQTYGTNKNKSNAFGKCVSKRTRTERSAAGNAAKECKAERADATFAESHDGKTFEQYYGTGKKGNNAYGKCVSSKAKASRTDTTKANVNAAKACKAERKDDAAAFKAKYGTNKNKSNAFGKCVSATAKKQKASEQSTPAS